MTTLTHEYYGKYNNNESKFTRKDPDSVTAEVGDNNKENLTVASLTEEERANLDEFRAKQQQDKDKSSNEHADQADTTEHEYGPEDGPIDLSSLFASQRADKLNRPTQEVIEKQKRRKIMMIGGGVLAAIAITVGISLPKKAVNTQVPKAPVTTTVPAADSVVSNVTPSTTEQAPVVSSTTTVETGIQSFTEVLKQDISVEKMEAMTIEDFAKLPYADRAAYFYMKIPDMPVPDANKKFDPTIIPGYYWQGIRATAVGAANTTDGGKLMGALSYYTTSEQTGNISDAYLASVNSIKAYGGAGVGISDVIAYVANGEPQVGTDRKGNKIWFTNITYQTYSETIDDKPIGNEITVQAFAIPVKIDDGRTIITYPMGYSIDGKQSPDSTFPY